MAATGAPVPRIPPARKPRADSGRRRPPAAAGRRRRTRRCSRPAWKRRGRPTRAAPGRPVPRGPGPRPARPARRLTGVASPPGRGRQHGERSRDVGRDRATPTTASTRRIWPMPPFALATQKGERLRPPEGEHHGRPQGRAVAIERRARGGVGEIRRRTLPRQAPGRDAEQQAQQRRSPASRSRSATCRRPDPAMRDADSDGEADAQRRRTGSDRSTDGLPAGPPAWARTPTMK